MELTPEVVGDVLTDFYSRCEAARMVGLPLYEVVDRQLRIPEGWWFDHDTGYYLPPGFQFVSSTSN